MAPTVSAIPGFEITTDCGRPRRGRFHMFRPDKEGRAVANARAPFVIAALAMERFLGFARGFRSQFAKLEKGVGVALVLTGVAFLTGGLQTMSSWLIETFPSIGTLG